MVPFPHPSCPGRASTALTISIPQAARSWGLGMLFWEKTAPPAHGDAGKSSFLMQKENKTRKICPEKQPC